MYAKGRILLYLLKKKLHDPLNPVHIQVESSVQKLDSPLTSPTPLNQKTHLRKERLKGELPQLLPAGLTELTTKRAAPGSFHLN